MTTVNVRQAPETHRRATDVRIKLRFVHRDRVDVAGEVGRLPLAYLRWFVRRHPIAWIDISYG